MFYSHLYFVQFLVANNNVVFQLCNFYIITSMFMSWKFFPLLFISYLDMQVILLFFNVGCFNFRQNAFNQRNIWQVSLKTVDVVQLFDISFCSDFTSFVQDVKCFNMFYAPHKLFYLDDSQFTRCNGFGKQENIRGIHEHQGNGVSGY